MFETSKNLFHADSLFCSVENRVNVVKALSITELFGLFAIALLPVRYTNISFIHFSISEICSMKCI